VPLCLAHRLFLALADGWIFNYTNFGESRGALQKPVLRAAFRVGVGGRRRTFTAIVDTGGPLTVVAHEVIASGGGDPVDAGLTLPVRLGGRSYVAPLYELTLEAWPSAGSTDEPIPWRGLVGVLSPFPHQGTSIILGQIGFLETSR
jgi:hypothetical protein